MSFENKKIIEDALGNPSGFSFSSALKALFILWSTFALWVLITVGCVRWYELAYRSAFPDHGSTWSNTIISKIIKSRWTNTLKAAPQSKKIINAMIVWIGGKGHRGAYNTDTIIVVSYNPANKLVNMISIPRDLYVNIDKQYYWRVNSILDYYLSQKKMPLTGALDMMKGKIGNLIGQDITYYGLIDFKWFESIIDTLWWLEVDVPENLYDPSFPVDDFNYWVLSIDAWKQIMDGNTALNYARSRHSTSDFDRSRRQQIIIKALLDKLVSIGSLSKIQALYWDVQQTVTTNAGITDIIKYLPYATRIGWLHNVVFQSDCPENINSMKHGCVLYSPDRSAFNGAAVLLPYGATPKSITDYTKLFKFVNRAIYYPFDVFDKIHLSIYNSIDKTQVAKPIDWFSSKLGVELIRNGLNVLKVGNNNINLNTTTMILLTWSMDKKEYALYNALVEDVLDIGNIQMIWIERLNEFYSGTIATGTDVMLLVWNNAVLPKPNQPSQP